MVINNGLTVQWGYISLSKTATNTTSTTINLPIVFTTAPLSGHVTAHNGRLIYGISIGDLDSFGIFYVWSK